MNQLSAVDIDELSRNVFAMLDKNWMLIASGDASRHNAMTASWGGFGVLWNRKVSFIFVRPSRYTFSLIEGNELYSLSFFPESMREALAYCGSHSGRDEDKIAAAGLKPEFPKTGGVVFPEASLVLVCRKLYSQDLDPERFIDPSIMGNYPERDFHRLYVGEIVRALGTPGALKGENQ